MGKIRPLEDRDVSSVAALHHRVFKTKIRPEDSSYREYLTGVFLKRRTGHDNLKSLVYETSDGRVMGFLGVVPRSLSLRGQKLRAALSTQFIVDPDGHGLVGLQLMQEFLAGPQDLSLTDEANEITRRLWTRFGGSASLFQSIHWIIPLRLGGLGLFLIGKRPLGHYARLLSPLVRVADYLAGHLPTMPLSLRPSRLHAGDLDGATASGILPEFAGDSLRPEYDAQGFDRIFEWALERRTFGKLHRFVLRSEDGRIQGWYVYHCSTAGMADVLQIGAREDTASDVLNHLVFHAWDEGAHAVTGRMEPILMHALAGRFCQLSPRRDWMLIHSRHPDLQCQLKHGEAFLSRLEGEWAVRFA